ncbi:MAG TPA: putative addiction module antidote protein [Elusimicrobia bacterium]|nr:putative addiction module antidote protein [Elusimicrobiota bacterium]
MKRYRTHEEYLDKALADPQEAARYMNAAAEENNVTLMLAVLAQVVRARGLSKTAKEVSVSRAGVYKMFSKSGNPGLKIFMGVLDASGIQMSFKPAHSPRAH